MLSFIRNAEVFHFNPLAYLNIFTTAIFLYIQSCNFALLCQIITSNKFYLSVCKTLDFPIFTKQILDDVN